MLDPDPYPDPHEINADPKPCLVLEEGALVDVAQEVHNAVRQPQLASARR